MQIKYDIIELHLGNLKKWDKYFINIKIFHVYVYVISNSYTIPSRVYVFQLHYSIVLWCSTSIAITNSIVM